MLGAMMSKANTWAEPLRAGCWAGFLVEEVMARRLFPEPGRPFCCCCCNGGVGGRVFCGILGRDGVFDFTLQVRKKKTGKKQCGKTIRGKSRQSKKLQSSRCMHARPNPELGFVCFNTGSLINSDNNPHTK